ncbi:hypothetical protein D7W81_10335 [Corallococcus aberystwythensis]|uniref:Uncharacterized protein n=2 Tax=Corallococcus aberystwythensis TaxID=2316722 RepID=A0A3A8R391_9BACT|nr:hypothetical protein D7W81_10335 [Corallococcus aberystwythensis]
MVERDIDLSECKEIGFVRHNPNMCCIDWKNCRERGMYDFKAATKFLGGHLAGYGFASAETAKWDGPPIEPKQLRDAWDSIESILTRHTKKLSFEDGSITVDDSMAPVLARSLFRVFATAPRENVDEEQLRNIAALFANQWAVLDACKAEFTRVFGELRERPI